VIKVQSHKSVAACRRNRAGDNRLVFSRPALACEEASWRANKPWIWPRSSLLTLTKRTPTSERSSVSIQECLLESRCVLGMCWRGYTRALRKSHSAIFDHIITRGGSVSSQVMDIFVDEKGNGYFRREDSPRKYFISSRCLYDLAQNLWKDEKVQLHQSPRWRCGI